MTSYTTVLTAIKQIVSAPAALDAAASGSSIDRSSEFVDSSGLEEMATPNNNNTSDEEKVDPLKDIRAGLVREVGSQAIWSLSSCKPGFGVDQLRDDCMETYWQSDGQLPHLVNIQFRRKTVVRDICIYIDYRLDESYTPGRISVRAGTHFNDLQEVEVVELNEPYGWVRIMTKDINEFPLKTYMIQIAVITNHQNGRDTHMRQIKVHSPVEKKDPLIGNFSTVEMRQYTIIK